MARPRFDRLRGFAESLGGGPDEGVVATQEIVTGRTYSTPPEAAVAALKTVLDSINPNSSPTAAGRAKARKTIEALRPMILDAGARVASITPGLDERAVASFGSAVGKFGITSRIGADQFNQVILQCSVPRGRKNG